jgi:hypothetical protein
MYNDIQTTRWLVALQGFTGLPDQHLKPIDIGLRVGPVFCMMLTAVGTALPNPTLLLTLSGMAFLGAVLSGNPFDVFYNYGLRHVLNGPRLPVYQAPRRFACAVASVWLLATVSLLYAGAVQAGQVMGWIMVGMASVPVITGFCVPSFLYRLVTGTMPARSVVSRVG